MQLPPALPRDFFLPPAQLVAPALLGALVVRRSPAGVMIGRIVESEAYLSAGDPACHGFRGVTPRTRVLFGPAGHAYVYSLRQHALLDVTTEAPGRPGAVLLRAIEPVVGTELMRANRGLPHADVRLLASGPGRLCASLNIDRSLDGLDLTDAAGELYLALGECPPAQVARSPRVGVTSAREAPLRFLVPGSPFVSRARPARGT